MIPACGPPSNLSHEKVTISAPRCNVCLAAGSSESHWGGPLGNQGQVESSRPDTISATRGIFKDASVFFPKLVLGEKS